MLEGLKTDLFELLGIRGLLSGQSQARFAMDLQKFDQVEPWYLLWGGLPVKHGIRHMLNSRIGTREG